MVPCTTCISSVILVSALKLDEAPVLTFFPPTPPPPPPKKKVCHESKTNHELIDAKINVLYDYLRANGFYIVV